MNTHFGFDSARRFLVLSALLLPFSHLQASTITWTGNDPDDSLWTSGANWDNPLTPPAFSDVFFGASGRTTNYVDHFFTINSLTFKPGAPSYTIILNGITGPSGGLSFETTGITTQPGTVQNFEVSDGLKIDFRNSSSAGAAHFKLYTHEPSPFLPLSAEVNFKESSSAGTAFFTLEGGLVNGNNSSSRVEGGLLTFTANSTAASATVTVHGASATSFVDPGQVLFTGSATAGQGSFYATGGLVTTAPGGVVAFSETSQAGSAVLASAGAPAGITNGGTISFTGSASAMNATITAEGSQGGANGGTITFSGSATAATATLKAEGSGADVSGAPGGAIVFSANSTAANSTILLGASPFSSRPGGTLTFSGNASPGTATVTTAAGSTIDISQSAATSISFSAVSGAGDFKIGSKTLSFTNASPVTFGGVISDGGIGGGTGGKLAVQGVAKLTLTGVSTFSGGTTIDPGATLQLGDGSAAPGDFIPHSSIVDNGTLIYDFANNPLNSGGLVAGFTNGPGTLVKNGSGTLTVGTGSHHTGGTTLNAGTLSPAPVISGPQPAILASLTAPVTVNGGSLLLTNHFNGVQFVPDNLAVGALSGTGGTISLTSFGAPGGNIFIVGNGDGSGSYAGTIMDLDPGASAKSLGLTKVGAGTQTLTGANNYSGATSVNGGTLAISVSGSLADTAITVAGGAQLLVNGNINNTAAKPILVSGTLSGSGNISAGVQVNNGGLLAPGDGVGRLSAGGDFLMQSTANLTLQLGGAPVAPPSATQAFDQIFTAGSFTLGGNLEVLLANGFVPSLGQKFFVLVETQSGTLSGTFANDTPLTAATGTIALHGVTYTINYADDAGGITGLFNDVSLTVTAVNVPEPTTEALWLSGLAGLGASRRPRQRRAASSSLLR